MSINRVYEIVCDECGCAGGHYFDNKRGAEKCFREDGGIVTKGKHFCSKDCEISFKKKKEISNEV